MTQPTEGDTAPVEIDASALPDGGEDGGSLDTEWGAAFDAAESGDTTPERASTGESQPPAADAKVSPAPEGQDATPTGDRTAADQPRQYTRQGAIDHLTELYESGRIAELTPEERGAWERFERSVSRATAEQVRGSLTEEQQAEQALREAVTEMMDDRATDEDVFNARLAEDPELATFYHWVRGNRPDLMNMGPRTYTQEQYQEAAQQAEGTARTTFFNAYDNSLAAIARDSGLDFASIRDPQKPETSLRNLIEGVANSRVEAALAKETERIRAAERQAAEQEWSARTLGSVTTPRSITTVGGRPGQAQPSGPTSWEQAYEEAAAAS